MGRTALLSLSFLLFACGASTTPSNTPVDGAANGSDGPGPLDLGAAPGDLGGIPADGGLEVCGNGIDDDGDLQADCADFDCALTPACIAGDVATAAPGLMPCGAAIALDAAATHMACTALAGTPDAPVGQTLDCSIGRLEATLQRYCNVGGTVVALWLHETLGLPEDTSKMLSADTFAETAYHAQPLTWVRYSFGGGSSSGPQPQALHRWTTQGAGETTHVIDVLQVQANTSVTRLHQVDREDSTLVVTPPGSVTTNRTYFYVGATTIAVTKP